MNDLANTLNVKRPVLPDEVFLLLLYFFPFTCFIDRDNKNYSQLWFNPINWKFIK